MRHSREHLNHRSTWLRAAVLGANDGIISTASIIIGVASTNLGSQSIFIAGLISLISGAFSMAAGEYVSVWSQKDLEDADLKMEQESINNDFAAETEELSQIYQKRGLSKDLAQQVAQQLMAYDPLAAHARDDIGLIESNRVNPAKAAISSALSFVIGALLPLSLTLLVQTQLITTVAVFSTLSLALLGATSAYLGKASIYKAVVRVSLWGVTAMVFSACVGSLFS